MTQTLAYAGFDPKSPLRQHTLERRNPGPGDVEIEILFCGVCHSDLHTVRGEWGMPTYPCVPGHEIVGRVTSTGSGVSKFKAGDIAAVGCFVDSCRTCPSCRSGLEQLCDGPLTFTYNSPDLRQPGKVTCGGYSTRIVVQEPYVLRIPPKLDLAAAAPLLCAGITTYSPLRHWKIGKGSKVGIVGLGGLGHMGVKFSHAFGARTVVFTTSPRKEADARRLGADEVVISTNPAAMKAQARTFDFILNTVSAAHDLDPYISALKPDGTLCIVGVPPTPHPSPAASGLIMARRTLAGSIIGGIAETQEMLDYCAAHDIACDIEMIPIQKINEAYSRMQKSDVRYRFVIDMASLKK